MKQTKYLGWKQKNETNTNYQKVKLATERISYYLKGKPESKCLADEIESKHIASDDTTMTQIYRLFRIMSHNGYPYMKDDGSIYFKSFDRYDKEAIYRITMTVYFNSDERFHMGDIPIMSSMTGLNQRFTMLSSKHDYFPRVIFFDDIKDKVYEIGNHQSDFDAVYYYLTLAPGFYLKPSENANVLEYMVSNHIINEISRF